MNKTVLLNQKGVVPILLLLSAIGIVATLLIISTFSFNNKLFDRLFVRDKSFASSDTIQIVDDQGNLITTTTSATVKVKLTSPTWSPVPLMVPSPTPPSNLIEIKRYYNKTTGDHWSSTSKQISSIPSGYTVDGSQGYLLASDDKSGLVVPFYDCGRTNSSGKIDHLNVLVTTTCTNFSQKAVLIGYIYKSAPSNQTSSNLYGCLNSTKTDYMASRSPLSKLLGQQQYPINCESTQNYFYQGSYGYTLNSLPTPTPTSSPTPVTTTSVVLAEDPNFINKQTLPFTTNLITYTFSDPTPGTKTLYAKFIASDGREQNATPFPATVQLVSTPISGPVTPTPMPTPTTPNLSLSPSAANLNIGCSYNLVINLNTAGFSTSGTDAILFFDPNKLFVNSITTSNIYPNYPSKSIDNTNGKISISGISSVSTPVSGSGKLATVNVAVKSTATVGTTQVKFDFDPNNKLKTTDSNIVQANTVNELLDYVVNGNYQIGNGFCTTP